MGDRNYRWRSLQQLRRERIAELLTAHKEAVTDELIVELDNTLRANERQLWIATLIQFGLFFGLLANLYHVSAHVQLFGIDVGTSIPVREILLLASALTGIPIWIIRHENTYIEDIIEIQLAVRYPLVKSIMRHRFRRQLVGHRAPTLSSGRSKGYDSFSELSRLCFLQPGLARSS